MVALELSWLGPVEGAETTGEVSMVVEVTENTVVLAPVGLAEVCVLGFPVVGARELSWLVKPAC